MHLTQKKREYGEVKINCMYLYLSARCMCAFHFSVLLMSVCVQ